MVAAPPGANPLFLRDEELRRGLELLFFAGRDLARQAEAALAAQGLGRAHYRALYFIGRRPGQIVKDLVRALGVTKQSVNRILDDLEKRGLIARQRGEADARQRRLALTEAGAALERNATAGQRALLARAYRQAGPEAVDGFRKVLAGLSGET